MQTHVMCYKTTINRALVHTCLSIVHLMCGRHIVCSGRVQCIAVVIEHCLETRAGRSSIMQLHPCTPVEQTTRW
eukprot:6221788-Amphidinium_carterae.1